LSDAVVVRLGYCGFRREDGLGGRRYSLLDPLSATIRSYAVSTTTCAASCGVSACYSWHGTRWVKQPRSAWMATTYAAPALPHPPLVATVSLPFSQETKAYIGAMVNGALAWFGKGTLCAYAVADRTVSLTLPIKIASKRGLI
jgi:hypothetical protein